MAQWIKKWFGGREPEPVNWPEVDLAAQIVAIRQAEAETQPRSGQLIHAFDFHEYSLRLDRDITGTYRLVANEGRERRYSFSIRGELEPALQEITAFLSGPRRMADLPRSETLKGHYYGSVEM